MHHLVSKNATTQTCEFKYQLIPVNCRGYSHRISVDILTAEPDMRRFEPMNRFRSIFLSLSSSFLVTSSLDLSFIDIKMQSTTNFGKLLVSDKGCDHFTFHGSQECIFTVFYPSLVLLEMMVWKFFCDPQQSTK